MNVPEDVLALHLKNALVYYKLHFQATAVLASVRSGIPPKRLADNVILSNTQGVPNNYNQVLKETNGEV